MSLQGVTGPPSFEYLRPDQEDRVSSALKLVKCHQGQIPKADTEHFERTLNTVNRWRLPSRAVLLLLTHHLIAHGIHLSEKHRTLFDRQVFEVASDCVVLDRSPILPTTPKSEQRRLRKERLRQLFLKAYTDLDLALLCLASHVSRMDAIGLSDYHAARLLAEDSEAIFLPLAEMLGTWALRRRLGDASLPVLNSKALGRIQYQQKQIASQQRAYFEAIRQTLAHALHKNGVAAQLTLHQSAPSSVYRRILRGESLGDLIKPLKIEIVVETVPQCYLALGAIHEQWPQMGRRTLLGGHFQDLIADPKFNGYRTLRSTIGYSPSDDADCKVPVEFRIYTGEMERVNGMGVVATRYLERQPQPVRNAWWRDERLLAFVREHPVGESTDEIFVFSPIGEVDVLPKGSSPIDYAYRCHSEIGHHCTRIWINGVLASYASRLRNGDLVEIEVDSDHTGPYERWLAVVKTSTAKLHIKRALKQRQEQPHKGRRIIDRILDYELNAHRLEIPRAKVDAFLEDTARYLNYPDLTALYIDIADHRPSGGAPKPSPNRIVSRLIAHHLADYVTQASGRPLGVPKNRVKFVQCKHDGQPCRVTPGSEIVGRLKQPDTPHTRLIVYPRDCPNAPDEDEAIALAWRGDKKPGEPVRVSIKAVDNPRLLDQVLNAVYGLYDRGAYLLEVHAKVDREGAARIRLTADMPDTETTKMLDVRMQALREEGTIDDVHIDALSPIQKLLLKPPDRLPNPYTTAPARGRRIFKGRDMEIAQIVACLEGDQNLVTLYGMQRVGKTSLLHYLFDHVAGQYGFVPVLLNLPATEEYSESWFWRRLAAEIDTAVALRYGGRRGRYKAYLRRSATGYDGLCEWLADLKPQLKHGRLLLLMDELNAFEPAEGFWEWGEANRVVYRLKSFVESHPDVGFVFSAQETLYKAAVRRKDRLVTWPLLRAGYLVRLDYLERSAAEKLVHEPVGQVLHYDKGVVGSILDVTACHPYYLQILMRHLILGISAPDRIGVESQRVVRVTLTDLEESISDLLGSGEHLFYDFVRQIDGPPRVVLQALAELSPSDDQGVSVGELNEYFAQGKGRVRQKEVREALASMWDLGVVERVEGRSRNARYRVRVPLFRQWLVKHRSLVG